MTTTEFSPGLPHPSSHSAFYSGIPSKRLFAWIFDMVFIVLISALIVPFTAFTAVFFFHLLLLVVGFIYRVATIASGSSTWGMRMTGIEFRDLKGEHLDGGQALLHTLGYSISMAFPVLQVISIMMILTTEKHQSLTDMVLGTAALNRKL